MDLRETTRTLLKIKSSTKFVITRNKGDKNIKKWEMEKKK